MSKLAIMFLLAYVSGLIMAIVKAPVWGIYVYQMVYFANPSNRWWGRDIPDIGYSFFSVLITIILFVVMYKKLEKVRLSEVPEAKWFFIIIITYLIVTPLAQNPEWHDRYLGYLVNLWVVIYLAFRLLDDDKKIELSLLIFIIGSAYIGYEAMMVGRNEFGRVEGVGTIDASEVNTVSAVLVPALSFALYLGWNGSNVVRVVSAIAALLVANGIILMNSRGAFLGVFVSVGYLFLIMAFSRYKLPRQRLFIALFLVASIAAVIRLADETFVERMMTLQTQSSIDSEGSGGRRMNYWLAAVDMAKDHPLGLGVFGYEALSRDYLHDESYFIRARGGVRSVHSTWFQGLAEIGWLGFACFLMLLYSTYRHMKRAKAALIEKMMLRQYYLIITIEAGILGFLAAGSFINMFRAVVLYWLLVLGISISVVSLRQCSRMIEKDESS